MKITDGWLSLACWNKFLTWETLFLVFSSKNVAEVFRKLELVSVAIDSAKDSLPQPERPWKIKNCGI